MKTSIPSIFSQQTLKQIEVIQVVVFPEISKLNHSVMKQSLVTCHPTRSNWLSWLISIGL